VREVTDKKKKMTEEFTMEGSCFSYVGDMSRKEAVEHFNNLMELGIYIEPDKSFKILREEFGFSEEKIADMRDKLEKSFEEGDEFYGHLIFSVICSDRATGQFGFDPEFKGRTKDADIQFIKE